MVLASGVGTRQHDICLVRLTAGASLPPPPAGCGIEVLVLAGTWQLPVGTLTKNGYTRQPHDHVGRDSTSTGAVRNVRR